MKNHPSIEVISLFLDETLSDEQRAGFEQHLAECSACRKKVELLQAAGQTMPSPKERLKVFSQDIISNLPSHQWDADCIAIGEIAEVQGLVQIHSAVEKAGVPAFPGCVLHEGDRLAPQLGAQAIVEWEDGGRSLVERDVELTEPIWRKLSELARQQKGAVTMNATNSHKPKQKRNWRYFWGVATAGVLCAVAAAAIIAPQLLDSQPDSEVATGSKAMNDRGSMLANEMDIAGLGNGMPANSNIAQPSNLYLAEQDAKANALHYNPTNGTTSAGDIVQVKDGAAMAGTKMDLSVSDGVMLSSKEILLAGNGGRVGGRAGATPIPKKRPTSVPTRQKNALAAGVQHRGLGLNKGLLVAELSVGGKAERGTQVGVQGATANSMDVSNATGVQHYGFGVRVESGSVNGDLALKLQEAKEQGLVIDDVTNFANRVIDFERSNTEVYDRIEDNPFLNVMQNPLSTFSTDVDTAAYANMRRYLIQQKQLPPKSAVRIEELINYFSYDYPAPDWGSEAPFSATVEIADCPWNDAHRLARIGLKGKEVAWEERKASNIVFLLDVSGSMNNANKLPLVKKSMELLVENLTENDTVAIVVYAGASGLVLPPTRGNEALTILEALDDLQAGGSTAGAAGIQLAYQTAAEHFVEGGLNRVILATDGDFNVGTSDDASLVDLITEKAKTGVFLTVLGFGADNTKGSKMEKLADNGNGNYAYIDTINEAHKVLVEELGGTMITIAKDVKIQVEFNPAQVGSYRLIGYENRILAAEDFNDDTKDAGEIGSGHTVTALYELVPAGLETDAAKVDPLKYQEVRQTSDWAYADEALTVKLRYKAPDGDTSKLMEFPVMDAQKNLDEATGDFKFAAGVAAFGMLLRDSEHKGSATLKTALKLAEEGLGQDQHGYREEFIKIIQQAQTLHLPKSEKIDKNWE